MKQRLDELTAEAKRLSGEGKLLTPDNAILRAFTADLETVLARNAALIDAAGTGVEETGIRAAEALTRQITLGTLTDNQLAGTFGVGWNVPDPAQVASMLNYVDRPAFRDGLGQFQTGMLDTVRNIVIQGQIEGRGPLSIASDLMDAVQNIPASYANSLLRSLQLTAWRDATVVNQLANADILADYSIRIATLDDRTCASCWALHGTVLPLGERVDDHWNGRCTSVCPIKGVDYNIPTGVDLFDNLSADQQQTILGPAAYAAYQAGDVTLSDFVEKDTDPIFGNVIQAASLKGVLGNAAKQYYQNAG